jgi:hypothetical protein
MKHVGLVVYANGEVLINRLLVVSVRRAFLSFWLRDLRSGLVGG